MSFSENKLFPNQYEVETRNMDLEDDKIIKILIKGTLIGRKHGSYIYFHFSFFVLIYLTIYLQMTYLYLIDGCLEFYYLGIISKGL